MRLFFSAAVIALVCTGCTRIVAEQWKDGTPKRSGSIVDGFQSGRWTYHHADGTVAAEGAFGLSMQDGEWTYRHPNGAVSAHGAYKHGLKKGPWSYHRPDGSLQASGSYHHDRQEGPWYSFGADGRRVMAAGWYQHGVADGPWLEFANDGSVSTAGMHVAGIRVGAWRIAGTVVPGQLPTGWIATPGTAPFTSVLTDAAGRRQFAAATIAGQEWLVDARGPVPLGLRLAGPDIVVANSGPLFEALPAVVTLPVAAPTAEVAVNSMTASAPAADLPPALPAGLDSDLTPAPAAAALEPVSILPGLWTTDQEENAASVVARFLHGQPNATGYIGEAAPEVSRARPAWHGKMLPQTRFLGADGQVLDLKRWHGKAVALVVMRGFSGQVCLYCAAQTAALAEAAPRLRTQGLEVLVVYPGPAEAVPTFVRAVASLAGKPLELPVALDPGLQLVRKLELAGNLALPATFLLDRAGVVRWTYVGTSIADRPSVRDIEGAVADLPR